MKKPRIAITIGDPNGIGPEVLLKSLADEELAGEIEPVVVGPAEVLERHAAEIAKCAHDLRLQAHKLQNVKWKFPVIGVAGGNAPQIQFGEVTEAAGRLAVRAIGKAVDLCLDGGADAMVTAPISKEAVRKAGFGYPGHTEYLAERTGSERHMMLMVSGAPGSSPGQALRVGVVSGHVPLREAPAALTREVTLDKLRVLDRSLRLDFGIGDPTVAVLGLNPHAGEGGMLGKEEIEIIAPALEQARAEGLSVEGPFPADGFFGTQRHDDYDAVLAAYHDQGLVPFKTLSFGRGVNFTAGLPIVRTSPDHGTAFDLAGKGRADPGSMKAALRLAASIARRRG